MRAPLVDISSGRPANSNADRRRGPRLKAKAKAERLARAYFQARRETLWFPRLDDDRRRP